MSLRKYATIGFAALAFSVTLPVFAVDALQSSASVSAACKQARQDLSFLQQLATTDGGTNPYLDAPTPLACKAVDRPAKENLAKAQPAEKTAGDSPATSNRFN